MRVKDFKLDCGVVIETWETKLRKIIVYYAQLDLTDLHNGVGVNNSILLIGKALIELDSMGYNNSGISLNYGYYNSIDGVTLTLTKKLIGN